MGWEVWEGVDVAIVMEVVFRVFFSRICCSVGGVNSGRICGMEVIVS